MVRSCLTALTLASLVISAFGSAVLVDAQNSTGGEEKQTERGLEMCKDLPGWSSFSREFALRKSPMIGLINGQPKSLVVWLQSKRPRLVDAIWWWDNLDQSDKPKLNWNELRATYDRAAADISRHSWLADWKRLGRGRSIELVLYGTKIGTDDVDLKYELPSWKDAGLKGAPEYYVLFRRNRINNWATVLFGHDEMRAISTANFLPDDRPASNHWLDRFAFCFHPAAKRGENGSKYIVISPSGYWQLRTYSKATPGGPRGNTPVRYSGGDGSSVEKAVVVMAYDEQSGVDGEYAYLKEHFPKNRFGGQSLEEHDGRVYDVFEFTTAIGRKRVIYFDITSFFGKS